MRRRLFALLTGSAGALLGVGCADIYSLGEYTTRGDSSARDPSYNEGAGGLGFSGARAPGTRARCETNADCLSLAAMSVTGQTQDPSAPWVCVKATSTCQPLLTPECPRVSGDYTNDDAVVVGTLLDATLERSAVLAAEEIDSPAAGGGLPAIAESRPRRPLVVVSCDAGPDSLAPARRLVEELHVAAIVGPMQAEAVVDVTQQVSAKDGTLLVTPASLSTTISNLPDDDLTWRVVASDGQRAQLVIDQMSALENVLRTTRALSTVKLGIVHRNDGLGASARDSITGKLIINGRFITDAANATNVSIDAYGSASDAAAQAQIVEKYAGAFEPDIVFVTAPEQIANVVVPLEQALTAARASMRPYYVVTEAAKTQALLDAVALPSMPADLRRRIRGIGATPDAKSAATYAGYKSRFAAKYGAPPKSFAEAATYDAMYAIAYGVAATPGAPPSGASVAKGLRGLGVGSSLDVGPSQLAQGLETVASGRSVSLRGTGTLMQWDPKGDIAGGTVEVWCVGTAGGAPSFGSSGLSMDIETQVIGGAFVQCQ